MSWGRIAAERRTGAGAGEHEIEDVQRGIIRGYLPRLLPGEEESGRLEVMSGAGEEGSS